MVITAKCAHCGAQIVFYETDEATICKYCDAVNAIPVSGLKANTAAPSKSTVKDEVILREVLPQAKFAANHQISANNSQGGHIWVTDHELYFKPHKANFGDLSKRYIRIQDICGYEKGLLTGLTIYTKKGYAMELAVWNKDEIINLLEVKRRAYYEDRWESVPALTHGDCHHFAIDTTANGYSVACKPKGGMKTWKKILIGFVIWWLLMLILLLFI